MVTISTTRPNCPSGSRVNMYLDQINYAGLIYGSYQGDTSAKQFISQGAITTYPGSCDLTSFSIPFYRHLLPINTSSFPADVTIGLSFHSPQASGPWEYFTTFSVTQLPLNDTWYWVTAELPTPLHLDETTGNPYINILSDANYVNASGPYLEYGLASPHLPLYGNTSAYNGSIWNSIPYSGNYQVCIIDVGGCINPTGAEDSGTCGHIYFNQNNHHFYICIDGNWVDQGCAPNCGGICSCTDPVGNLGDTTCIDGYVHHCVEDYGWVTSSEKCTGGCSNPSGINGVQICGDPTKGQDPTHRYVCNNGVWEDLGFNEECNVPAGYIRCWACDENRQQIYHDFPDTEVCGPLAGFGDYVYYYGSKPTCSAPNDWLKYLPYATLTVGGIILAYAILKR